MSHAPNAAVSPQPARATARPPIPRAPHSDVRALSPRREPPASRRPSPPRPRLRGSPPPLPDLPSLASEDDVVELALHDVSLDDAPTAVSPVPRMSPTPPEPIAAPLPHTTLPAPPSIEPAAIPVPPAPAVPRESDAKNTSSTAGARDDDTAMFAAAMRPRRSAAALAITVGLYARAVGIFSVLVAAASFAWLRANLPRLRLWTISSFARAREEWSRAVERASSRRS